MCTYMSTVEGGIVGNIVFKNVPVGLTERVQKWKELGVQNVELSSS